MVLVCFIFNQSKYTSDSNKLLLLVLSIFVYSANFFLELL